MAKFKISHEFTTHGSISWVHLGSDAEWAEAGSAVKIMWQCDAKWGLQEAHYTLNGVKHDIDITTDEPQFVMPEGDITIGGTFKRFVLQDWTEGRRNDINNEDPQIFAKGPNGQPIPITLAQLIAAICDDALSLDSVNPVQNRTITAALALKQALLESGVNIKTINGASILGDGNLAIGGTDLGLESLGFSGFLDTVDYTAGEIVVENGSLWRFTEDHAAGAWTGTDAEQVSFLELLADGTIEILASDITPKNNTPVDVSSLFAIQTTGGDADVKNSPSFLRGFRGNFDDDMNPFLADSFVSTGDNYVDQSKHVTIGGNYAYIFPVTKGTWGAYGTTQENNGYVILSAVTPDAVYFKATKPTGSSHGSACPSEVHNGRTYYLPPTDGWLCIAMPDTVTVPACHIAWSNYRDNIAGTFNNLVKNIGPLVQWIHPWGMGGIVGAQRSVFDDVDVVAQMCHRRLDESLLTAFTWTMSTDTSGDTPMYIFTATVSAMASNGLWKSDYNGLEVSGKTLTIKSADITDLTELATALDGYRFGYELATYVSASFATIGATLSQDSQANDFGLTYFMNGTELATVPAYVTEAFYQGGKDQLFNAVTYQKILAEVVAAALNDLNVRLLNIEGKTEVECVNLKVSRRADIAGWREVDTPPASASAPGTPGDYHVATDYLYICVAANTWKRSPLSTWT